MSYFLPNLGRRYTADRVIECLASATGLTLGSTTYRVREGSGPWTPSKPYEPRFLFTLTEDEGDKTVEIELDDGSSTVNISHTITLQEGKESYVSWYPETQRIANEIPQWHPGRRLRSSEWQKFMNGLGMAMDSVNKSIQHYDNAKILYTCPVDDIDLVGRVYPNRRKLFSPKDDNANLIFNPTFSLFRDPFGEPEQWALSTTGNTEWSTVSTPTLFGFNTLQTSPADGERATAVQILPITLGVGESMTAALYYQTPISGSTTPPNSVDFALQAVVLYEDGDSEISSVTLQPETDSRWELAEITVTPTKIVTRAYLIVNLDGISGLSPFQIRLGAAMVQRGTSVDRFSYGNTKPHHMKSAVHRALEPSDEIWLTDSEMEFGRKAIPTRIDSPGTSQDSGAFSPLTEAIRAFTLYDAQDQAHEVGYVASSGQIQFTKIDGDTQSPIKNYDLAFYNEGAEGYVVAPDFTVEAVTFFNDRLWAVGKFDDQSAADDVTSLHSWEGVGAPVQGSDRTRYLCLVKHLTPRQPTDYMEVIQSWPLNTFADNNPIVQIEFQNSDSQWIHYWTATDHYYSRLYYDYGLVNDDGSIWIREVNSEVSFS